MATEVPVQSIAAIATLVAALITAAVSFVNMTLNKELKTSEFRQAWIDGLREDLSRFLGAARAFARAVEERNVLGVESKDRTFSDARIGDLRYQAAETLSKIRLRLNPSEPEHQELLRLLQRAVEEQNAMIQSRSSPESTLAAIEVASDYARPVLKVEWERVKQGELAFRIARNWLAPAVFLVSVSLVAFFWYGRFAV